MAFRQRIAEAADAPDGIARLKKALEETEAVVLGAGAGLSTSAGFI